MTEDETIYEWSDHAALWQVEHGEADTPRTVSAFTHLEVSLNGGDAETTRSIALRLLGIVEHFSESVQ